LSIPSKRKSLQFFLSNEIIQKNIVSSGLFLPLIPYACGTPTACETSPSSGAGKNSVHPAQKKFDFKNELDNVFAG
jgi:hypothetical protein